MTALDSGQSTANRWLILLVLFFARTAIAFQFQSIAAVSPLLVAELNLDLALLGALIGAWMLPGVFFALPGGLLGQRFGDRNVVVFGLAQMVAGSAIVAAAEGYALAMTGRVVSGIGAVILNVLLTKMAADWFTGRELSTAMGLLVTSWPLGIGIALVTLGPLAAAQGWQQAIAVTAIVCAVALVVVAVVYRAPVQMVGAPVPAQWGWTMTRGEFRLVLVASLVWALYNVGFIVLMSFAPVLLAEQSGDASNAAIVASFATWPFLATVPLGGMLADRTGRGFAIMIASISAAAVGMPLILVTGSPLLTLAVIGALMGPAAGVIMSLPASVLTAESRHAGMGFYYTVFYLAMTLLPGAAGWLRESTGVGIAPLLFGSATLLAAIGCALLFRALQIRRAAVTMANPTGR